MFHIEEELFKLPAQSQQFPMACASFALRRSFSVFANRASFSMTPWSVMTARFSLSLKKKIVMSCNSYLSTLTIRTLPYRTYYTQNGVGFIAETYLAMFAMAKHTAAKTSMSFDSRRLQMSSRPPTKLRTMSPELAAFLMQGLKAQAALAWTWKKSVK